MDCLRGVFQRGCEFDPRTEWNLLVGFCFCYGPKNGFNFGLSLLPIGSFVESFLPDLDGSHKIYVLYFGQELEDVARLRTSEAMVAHVREHIEGRTFLRVERT